MGRHPSTQKRILPWLETKQKRSAPCPHEAARVQSCHTTLPGKRRTDPVSFQLTAVVDAVGHNNLRIITSCQYHVKRTQMLGMLLDYSTVMSPIAFVELQLPVSSISRVSSNNVHNSARLQLESHSLNVS